MKDKIGKWMKRYWAVACFAIAVILLIVSGSFAAYTSFNSVKRVVSTGKRSDTMFGSNYLTLVDDSLDDASQYTVKRISPNGDKDTGYTFIVQVCNYVYGNETTYNPKDITYTLNVQVMAKDGGSLPTGVTNITINSNNKMDSNGGCELSGQTLSTGAARRIDYTFSIPADLKDNVKIQIVAQPTDSASINAVNNQKLAAVITFSDLEPTKNWTGNFIDSKEYEPNEYDAFNYEISGNGAGTVTLTWSDSLQISKWFIEDRKNKGSYISNGSNNLIFSVEEDVTAYQLQFYRNPETPLNITGENASAKWAELERMVECKFDAKSGTASTDS